MPQGTDAGYWRVHRRVHWVIFIIVAMLGIAVLFFANARFLRDWEEYQTGVSLVPKEQSVIVRVTIEFGDAKRAFEAEADSAMTIRRALESISGLLGSRLVVSQGIVREFAGRVSGSSGRWGVYQNGVLAGNADTTKISGGDRILVRYQQ